MLHWSAWFARIAMGIISIVDASNLRNRVAEMEDEHELMWTALDDIKRMYPDHKSGSLAKHTLTKIKRTYGR
jgi:hypothetical protein